MTLQYKIILVSELDGILSDLGKELLLVARYSNDRTKTIHCINHPSERISATFKTDFDVKSFLSNKKTYSHKEALAEMKKDEWQAEEGDG